MEQLILKSGPKLVRRDHFFDRIIKEASITDEDVTKDAHMYLFSEVTVDRGVRLSDIVKLVDKSAVLRSIQSRNFCDELLIEARKGPINNYGKDKNKVQYLKLDGAWLFDTDNKTYLETHRPSLRAVGVIVHDDSGNFEPGQEVTWPAREFAVRKLLDLRVYVSTNVVVYSMREGWMGGKLMM